MAIDLDIEDVIGGGCLSSLGRALAALSCLWLGAATGSLAFLLAQAATELLEGGTPDLGELLVSLLRVLAWGPLLVFTGNLIPFFIPLVLLVYFKFARGDGGTLKSWVIFAGATGLLVLLSARPWDELGLIGTGLGAIGWLGFVGGMAFLAYFLVAWQRRRFQEHLRALAEATDERRRLLAETFGTAVADREFATGEASGWSPPPDSKRPHPKVPKPGPPTNQD